jgi:hypothetical protein
MNKSPRRYRRRMLSAATLAGGNLMGEQISISLCWGGRQIAPA